MTNRRKVLAAPAVALIAAGCAGPAARSSSSIALTTVATSSTTAPAPTTSSSTSSTSSPPIVSATTATTKASPPTSAPVPAVSAAGAQASPTPPACASNLANQLAFTGSARQLITVEAAGWETSVAEVELWQRAASGCWQAVAGPWPSLIGENGFSDHHTEGDGTTPTGIYGVGPKMYGNAPNPGVQETYVHLVCGDWWDEDPTSADYNTFQPVPCGQTPPFGGGSEPLWKESGPYPSFAVIDYNSDPIRPYAGSAIFFHADTGVATTGCVSVPLVDLDQALRWMDPAEQPVFVMGPASEITGF